MTKTKKTCKTCGTTLEYNRRTKTYFCPQCAYGAFLTDQAQRDAVKRYRESEKGRDSEKKYEQSEKGRTARERYLKSDKYKQRRKEYNQRLKESLGIARAAELDRAKKLTPAEGEAVDEFAALVQDIREYIDSSNRVPSPADVRTWAEEEYKLKLTDEQARELLQKAQKH